MSGDPGGIGSRVMKLCIGLLLAAMALYGAVAIIKTIWVPLCIVVTVICGTALAVWLFALLVRLFRSNRW